MEHIIYLIALHQPNDLKYVKRHAAQVAKHLKKMGETDVSFGALAAAKREYESENIICIGDNRKDTLVFSPIKQFQKDLRGYTYLPIKGEYNGSVFSEFGLFLEHETRNGNNSMNKDYHIIVVDFRKSSSVFVGNEADLIVKSLEFNLSSGSSLDIICHRENIKAYQRIVELLSDKITPRTFGARGKKNPLSASAVADIFV